MINSIYVKNFKSIKEKKFLLRNLNVAMGLNSMGKSTFIQTLLLLKQSDNLINGELRLNDNYVKLGRGKDVFYQYNKDEILSIVLEFNDDNIQDFNFKYNPEADFLETDTAIKDDVFTLPLFSHNFKYLNAERLAPKVIYDKSYTDVVSNKYLGVFGQYTVHYLNYYGNEEIEFENIKHKNTEAFVVDGVEKLDLTLVSQVNHWLSEISPGVRINTAEINNSDNIQSNFQYRQPNRGYTNNFRPTNVGFGISYVLPVITTLLSAKPGQLIIIENPESHIHPRGQSQLGRLIALVAMNDVQIIIETHSDHILNGIRVAVKEADISKDKVSVFYFDKVVEETEQYTKVIDIQIDQNGELNHYPQNFMDTWTNQLLKLL